MENRNRLISAFIGSLFILFGTLFYFFSDPPISITSHRNAPSPKVDIVVFSYNRPMQLYACLESICTHLTNIAGVTVIARASEASYVQGYEEVKKAFPDTEFLFQGENPKEDFKPLVMQAVYGSPARFVAFAVDDLVVKDSVDLAVCAEAIKSLGGWGFYLRLGKNINYNYMAASSVPIPPLRAHKEGIFSWTFGKAEGDWAYANSVDMTVYSKEKIRSDLEMLPFYSPNSFESNWAQKTKKRKKGLCFDVSKVVNIPLNLVNVSSNRNMQGMDVSELLKLFQSGLKMDIRPFCLMSHKSAHEEIQPVFIKRSNQEYYTNRLREKT
jgi:hypothetical protein